MNEFLVPAILLLLVVFSFIAGIIVGARWYSYYTVIDKKTFDLSDTLLTQEFLVICKECGDKATTTICSSSEIVSYCEMHNPWNDE